jgi:hypothetical protein
MSSESMTHQALGGKFLWAISSLTWASESYLLEGPSFR